VHDSAERIETGKVGMNNVRLLSLGRNDGVACMIVCDTLWYLHSDPSQTHATFAKDCTRKLRIFLKSLRNVDPAKI
jgi:hypothetical protein